MVLRVWRNSLGPTILLLGTVEALELPARVLVVELGVLVAGLHDVALAVPVVVQPVGEWVPAAQCKYRPPGRSTRATSRNTGAGIGDEVDRVGLMDQVERSVGEG